MGGEQMFDGITQGTLQGPRDRLKEVHPHPHPLGCVCSGGGDRGSACVTVAFDVITHGTLVPSQRITCDVSKVTFILLS